MLSWRIWRVYFAIINGVLIAILPLAAILGSMTQNTIEKKEYKLAVERIEKLNQVDLQDLCDATIAAIELDGGFGWTQVPQSDVLKRYWQGVVTVPQRDLFVARLDGAIAGTAQLVRVPPNNQAQNFATQLTTFFVAPWARGFGLGGMLVKAVEERAIETGLHMINLDVRETQFGAIKLFKKMGYTQWGMHPYYAIVNDRTVPGYFFYKVLRDLPSHIIPIET